MTIFGNDKRGIALLKSVRKTIREELSSMHEAMFEEALKRQKEINMAKKKGCKKGGSKKKGK